MEVGYRYDTGMEASSRYPIPVSLTQPVCHPYQEGGNHFRNFFILEYAMMMYIVLTLFLIDFVVLKNSSPLELASGK